MARGGGLDWRDDRYYRSTKTNAQLLTGYDMGYGRMLTGGCWAMVVCPILMIASLPLDAALDTVLLPYDAFQPARPQRNMHVDMKRASEADLPALPLGAAAQDPTAASPPISTQAD
ncbi:YceK/YidQ family lipoprotein [Pseudomonas sp. Fl5BN2]|nr:YceK/YidQ family lipoprotein [Pseudomonas sp. Fl5BN2]NBF12667.1 YceK/YidQ family lipoprotein [Pseudomonas sp. Fl4BN1]